MVWKDFTKKDLKEFLKWMVRGYNQGYVKYYQINGKGAIVSDINIVYDNVELGDMIYIEVSTSKNYSYVGTIAERLDFNNARFLDYRDEKLNAVSIASRKMRDYQRSKLYKWEKSLNSILEFDKILDNQTILETAKNVCSLYNIPVPKIIVTAAKKQTSTYYPYRHEIRLAKGWGQKLSTVIHELAHAVKSFYDESNKHSAHGAVYTGIYMDLLEMFLNADRGELNKNARKFKLNHVDVSYSRNMRKVIHYVEKDFCEKFPELSDQFSLDG